MKQETLVVMLEARDFSHERFTYISASVRDDNPASYRTAQKSGFKLIDKRIGFDNNNADCNVDDFIEVGEYFAKIVNNVGSGNYYFLKFNSNKTLSKPTNGGT